MKPREPRRKILIAARMRAGSAWGEVCLLNISSRGALAQAAVPPPKGTYVEVRRGSHVLTARVVWTEKHRFGVFTQDPIRIDEFISEPDNSNNRDGQSAETQHQADRRAFTRNPASDGHERSRFMARSMEFCFFVGSVAICSGIAFTAVRAALAEPMAQVSAILSPK